MGSGVESVLALLFAVFAMYVSSFEDERILYKPNEVCSDYIPATEEEGCVKWKPIKVKVEDKTEKPEPEEEPVPESEEETSEPEPEEETTSKNDADDTVVDINGKDKGKNNQSDEGYETKPETDKKTGPAAGSSGDENGSTVVTASMLVTLITIFLTIVV